MHTIVKNLRAYAQIIFIFFFFFHVIHVYAQDETGASSTKSIVEKNQLQNFENTLLYGVDASVIATLKTLTELEFKDYEELVLERMKDTINNDIIVAGFTYFNTLKIHNVNITNFAIETIKNYQNLPRQAIQYAMSYIKSNNEQLSKEETASMLALILDIIDTDNPAIALTALELIPAIYTEKDIAQLTTENEENAATQDDTQQQDEPKENLYSAQLKARYSSSNIPNIQQQIILVLGQIQALNEIDFIMDFINTNATNTGVTYNAILALSYFVNLSPEAAEKIKTTYSFARTNITPIIRVATIEALAKIYDRTQDEEYLKWIQNALRDNELIVRNTALDTFYDIFKKGKGLEFQKSLVQVITYMIENDPEYTVRSKAITTLSIFSDAHTRDYLTQKIAKITTLGIAEKTLISIALSDTFANQESIKTLIDVVESQRNKSNSSVLTYIASEMSKSSNKNILPLLDALMTHSDTQIMLYCMTTIKKHRLTSFIATLESIASDIFYPLAARNRAQQVSEYLLTVK